MGLSVTLIRALSWRGHELLSCASLASWVGGHLRLGSTAVKRSPRLLRLWRLLQLLQCLNQQWPFHLSTAILLVPSESEATDVSTAISRRASLSSRQLMRVRCSESGLKTSRQAQNSSMRHQGETTESIGTAIICGIESCISTATRIKSLQRNMWWLGASDLGITAAAI